MRTVRVSEESALRARNPVRGLLQMIFVVAAFGVLCVVTVAAYFARKVLTPSKQPDAGVSVLSIAESSSSPVNTRVWLSGPDVALRGSYSFIWNSGAGHARLGPVQRVRERRRKITVVREVLSVERGELRVGIRGRITGWWYVSPAEFGLPYERVEIESERGHIWAWVIHAAEPERCNQRWAVHVHGRGALPEETLRGVPALAKAGVSSLVLAYRNDPGTSRGAFGRYGLGLAEWRDVESALDWLRSRGASQFTLVGWSMGATACVIASRYSAHRGIIDGIVLDSPALDWPQILRHQARLAKLPNFMTGLAMKFLQRGWVRGAVSGSRGTDIAALDADRIAEFITKPTLIHVSEEDSFVSWQGALRVANLKPELVVLRQVSGEHVKLWNVDPEGWEAATEQFVRRLSLTRHAAQA